MKRIGLKKLLKPKDLFLVCTLVCLFIFRVKIIQWLVIIFFFLIFTLWDIRLGICMIGLLFTRADTLRVYRNVYSPEEYKQKFDVTMIKALQNGVNFLEAAIFGETTENVITTDLTKFVAPLLLFMKQPTKQTTELLSKMFRILNFEITVRGLEKIPKDVPLIVIANHITPHDGFLIIPYVNEVRGQDNTVVLSRQFTPSLKTDPNIVGAVTWQGHLTNGTWNQLAERVTNGQALLFFPEGRLLANKFSDGYLRMAIQTNAWIQPVHLKMTFPKWIQYLNWILPHSIAELICALCTWRVYMNNRVEMVFGDPISPGSLLEDTGGQTYIDKRGKVRYLPAILNKHLGLVKGLR